MRATEGKYSAETINKISRESGKVIANEKKCEINFFENSDNFLDMSEFNKHNNQEFLESKNVTDEDYFFLDNKSMDTKKPVPLQYNFSVKTDKKTIVVCRTLKTKNDKNKYNTVPQFTAELIKKCDLNQNNLYLFPCILTSRQHIMLIALDSTGMRVHDSRGKAQFVADYIWPEEYNYLNSVCKEINGINENFNETAKAIYGYTQSLYNDTDCGPCVVETIREILRKGGDDKEAVVFNRTIGKCREEDAEILDQLEKLNEVDVGKVEEIYSEDGKEQSNDDQESIKINGSGNSTESKKNDEAHKKLLDETRVNGQKVSFPSEKVLSTSENKSSDLKKLSEQKEADYFPPDQKEESAPEVKNTNIYFLKNKGTEFFEKWIPIVGVIAGVAGWGCSLFGTSLVLSFVIFPILLIGFLALVIGIVVFLDQSNSGGEKDVFTPTKVNESDNNIHNEKRSKRERKNSLYLNTKNSPRSKSTNNLTDNDEIPLQRRYSL